MEGTVQPLDPVPGQRFYLACQYLYGLSLGVWRDQSDQRIDDTYFQYCPRQQNFLDLSGEICRGDTPSPQLFQEFHSGKRWRTQKSVRYQTQGYAPTGGCWTCSSTTAKGR